MNSYWTKVYDARLSRRRTLGLAMGASVGSALLAACGGSDTGKSGQEVSSLVRPASDDSKSAIKGGIYKGISPLNLLQIDPHQPGGHIGVVRRVYSQLFRVKD